MQLGTLRGIKLLEFYGIGIDGKSKITPRIFKPEMEDFWVHALKGIYSEYVASVIYVRDSFQTMDRMYKHNSEFKKIVNYIASKVDSSEKFTNIQKAVLACIFCWFINSDEIIKKSYNEELDELYIIEMSEYVIHAANYLNKMPENDLSVQRIIEFLQQFDYKLINYICHFSGFEIKKEDDSNEFRITPENLKSATSKNVLFYGNIKLSKKELKRRNITTKFQKSEIEKSERIKELEPRVDNDTNRNISPSQKARLYCIYFLYQNGRDITSYDLTKNDSIERAYEEGIEDYLKEKPEEKIKASEVIEIIGKQKKEKRKTNGRTCFKSS